MLSVAGADHIITMDLHASQIQVRFYNFDRERAFGININIIDILNHPNNYIPSLKIYLFLIKHMNSNECYAKCPLY